MINLDNDKRYCICDSHVRFLEIVIINSLLENKLGLLKYKLLPSWKNEGYCDFIANESSFNKQKGVKEICNDTKNTDSPSFKYFKYRMITEYLFEERKVTLEKFLDEDFDLFCANFDPANLDPERQILTNFDGARIGFRGQILKK